MKIALHVRHSQTNDREMRTYHALSVETTPTFALCGLLRLPKQELMTGTGGILAEPLTAGASRLYYARAIEVAEDKAQRSLARFGAVMLGVLVSSGACMFAAPYVGTAALTFNAVVCIALPLVYLGLVLRDKVESRALEAAILLSRNYDAMADTSQTSVMAERYAKAFHALVLNARTFGYVDERLEPACRQYAARYNEKFGEPSALA